MKFPFLIYICIFSSMYIQCLLGMIFIIIFYSVYMYIISSDILFVQLVGGGGGDDVLFCWHCGLRRSSVLLVFFCFFFSGRLVVTADGSCRLHSENNVSSRGFLSHHTAIHPTTLYSIHPYKTIHSGIYVKWVTMCCPINIAFVVVVWSSVA